jgi:hypothetical protein
MDTGPGERTGVAIESMSLVDPILILLIIIFLGIGLYDYNTGTGYDEPTVDRWSLRYLLFAGAIIASRLFLDGLHSSGSIRILRGREEAVLDAIKQILAHHNLRYRLVEDVFDIPSIKMKIEVDYHPNWGQVSIFPRTKDKDWRETIHEGLMNTFEGTPSARSYPALLILSGVFVGVGIALGVAFVIG